MVGRHPLASLSILVLGWTVGALVMLVLWPAPGGDRPIEISIASSIGKQEWLHQAVREFNAASPRNGTLQTQGRPIVVDVLQETVDGRITDYRSGTMISDTLAGRIRPTVLSPADESAISGLARGWQATNGTQLFADAGTALARTPLVLAMWRSRAEALGCWQEVEPSCTWGSIRTLAAAADGWGSVGHPEWGSLKLGYGYMGEDSPGTLGTILECMIGAGKTTDLVIADVGVNAGCGRFVGDIERAKVHSGVNAIRLLGQMAERGPDYLDAVVIYESDVIGLNRNQTQTTREPIVCVYPQDGTILVGHPFAILDGAPWVDADQVAAARVLQRFLLSAEQQKALVAAGLRPVDPSIPAASPIDPSYGPNPGAQLVAVSPPGPGVSERIADVWHRVKKHAVVALVFDKSSAMAGGKIGSAIEGAQEFVRRMDADDRLLWRPFDGTVYPAIEGSGSQGGQLLVDRIGATPAGGESALYDAVVAAYDQLAALRRDRRETLRYGIVVLSDGHDTSSRTTRAELESKLRGEADDPDGIQIHTIAIGADADEGTLWSIANAAQGSFWKGQTADEMVTIYKAIATYY